VRITMSTALIVLVGILACVLIVLSGGVSKGLTSEKDAKQQVTLVAARVIAINHGLADRRGLKYIGVSGSHLYAYDQRNPFYQIHIQRFDGTTAFGLVQMLIPQDGSYSGGIYYEFDFIRVNNEQYLLSGFGRDM